MNPNRKRHEEILKLISLIRDQPCLWDTNLEESKSVNARKAALEGIANRLNVTSEDVRRKLHNLRSQYRREKIRMSKLKTNKPKWVYFNVLKFLGPTFKAKWRPPGASDCQKETKTITSQDIVRNFELPDDESSIAIEENHFDTIRSLTINNKEIHRTDIEEFNVNQLNANDKDSPNRIIILPSQSQQDEYAVFGENVANELRSLESNKNLQHLLKCKILQAILDVNKAIYDSATTTSRSSFEDDESQLPLSF